MPKTTIDTLFPSRFLKAANLDGETKVTIKMLAMEDIKNQAGETEQKPVLYFQEFVKGLPLNKTNAASIAKLHGKDFAAWTGKTVTLYSVIVEVGGESYDTIRIK